MTAALAPSVFLDRSPQVRDRVRWPGNDTQVSWVGVVYDFPADPIDVGIARCKVPGIPGYVRVSAARLQVLAGAR